MAIKARLLDSGSYRARVTYFEDDKDGNRKQHSESFTRATKKEAEAAANEFKVNRIKQQKPENFTLGEAMDKYLEGKDKSFSPSTIALYTQLRNYSFPTIINKRLGALTSLMIQRAIGEYGIGKRAKTVRNAYSFLRQVLITFKLAELCNDIKLPDKDAIEMKIPTRAEVYEFLEKLKENRLYIYVLLDCYCGLRRSEIVAITWEDINFETGYVSINKARVKNKFAQFELKKPKTTKSNREVKLPLILIEELQRILTTKEVKPQDYVIDISPDAIKARYERARVKYGFSYNFHALRHYFTSELLVMGVPTKYASEIIGHSTTHTTQRVYQHTFPEKKTEIFNQFDNMVNQLHNKKEEEGV